MTVRDRLVLTFLVVVTVLVLPPLYAALRFGQMRELAVDDRAGHAGAAVALGRVQTAAADVDRLLRSYAATPSPALERSLRDGMTRLSGAAQAVGTAGYADEADPLLADVDALAAAVQGVLGLVDDRRLALATDSVLALRPALDEVRRQVDQVAAAVDTRAASDFRRADDIARSGRDMTLLAMGAALAAAVAMAFWTTRGLAGPLRRLDGAMSDVAAGTFVAPADLPYDRRDEIGRLASSFRTMTGRLEELDRLRAEFLGVAGHEMKTPVNVIRGYTELIEEELATDLTEHQADVLRRIGEQTTVLTRLVSRLMDLSRLESGHVDLEREPTRIDDLLLGLERRYEILARRKDVDLTVARDPGGPEWVDVDMDRVRDEVLGNLVSNALEFTPAGGWVRVEARAGPRGVLVEVADSGPGIPPEHRDHIFERYYQVRRSRTVGSGLGLAIARHLAEAHGGRIHLADADPDPPGTGAVFHLHLPTLP
ncbi:MAG: ATP-binding protein [Longimicrobiales bacterium]